MVLLFILAPDNKTILATIYSNLLATEHTMYEAKGSAVLLTLTLPLFTWSRDSEVKIVDKSRLLSVMDPNLVMAALALHSGTPRTLDVDPVESADIPEKFQSLALKLRHLSEVLGFSEAAYMSSAAQLKMAADILNERYRQVYDDTYLSEDEKIEQFVNFGCELIHSNTFSRVEEKAMIDFLMQRLKGE